LNPTSDPGVSNQLYGSSKLEMSSYRYGVIAFLGGLSLFLSTIEYVFPKPVPFFRLGLANIPILLSLGVLSPKELLLLGMLKILGQGLVNGTLASYVFLFSLGGTTASILAMYGYYRLFPNHSSYIGISLIGALASNLVQVWLSLQFIFGRSAWIIVPYFLGMGGATGLVMGLFASVFVRKSTWFSDWLSSLGGPLKPGLPGGLGLVQLSSEPTKGTSGHHEVTHFKPNTSKIQTSENLKTTESAVHSKPSPKNHRAKRSWGREWRARQKQWIQDQADPRVLFLGGFLILILYAFQSNLEVRVFQVFIAYCLASLTGKKIRLGYFILLVISISLFSLLQPAGAVLLRIGTFAITQGALEQGLFRGLTLVGFVFLSLAMVQPHLQLPGLSGFLLTKTFQYYESFNHFRGELGAKGFIEKITQILYRIFPPQIDGSFIIDSGKLQTREIRKQAYQKTSWKIWLLLILLVGGFYLAL
jgi:uncharacterized membrane protein